MRSMCRGRLSCRAMTRLFRGEERPRPRAFDARCPGYRQDQRSLTSPHVRAVERPKRSGERKRVRWSALIDVLSFARWECRGGRCPGVRWRPERARDLEPGFGRNRQDEVWGIESDHANGGPIWPKTADVRQWSASVVTATEMRDGNERGDSPGGRKGMLRLGRTSAEPRPRQRDRWQ